MDGAAQPSDITALPAEVQELVRTFEQLYPFPLDLFQRQAVAALAERRSVLVTAPTATGKTVIAEFAIWQALRAGRAAIYTTPIKALSNQKYRDLRAVYGPETVGLMTGDIVENSGGRVLVMTTEVLRNMLLQDSTSVAHVHAVIFDEIHFLADPERGTTWEEALILCPRQVQLACLSATVGNAEEFASWLASLRGPGELVHIDHQERAVPLEHRYLYDGKLVPFLSADGQVLRRLNLGGELGRRVRFSRVPSPGGRPRGEIKEEPSPPEVVRQLAEADLLPAIYFVFSRRATEEAAEKCVGLGISPYYDGIMAVFHEVVDSLPAEDRGIQQVEALRRLLPRGLAFHHAGMLPALKVVVEDLLAAGRLRVVFATDTLSLGINAPARAVVLGELTKFDGVSRRLLTTNEYRQLTGRAGRRGLDERGVAVVLYSPWVSFAQALRLARGPLDPLESAFRPGYSTAANLWLQGDAEKRLARLAGRSLRRFQRQTDVARLVEERSELAAQLAAAATQKLRDGRPRKRARTLAAALAALESDLEHARSEAGTGGRQLLRGLRLVLERFGYLRKGEPQPRLERLAVIFDTNALTLSELIERGLLRGLSPAELTEVAAWFAHDRDSGNRPLPLPTNLYRLREKVFALHREVMDAEDRYKLQLSRPLPSDLVSLALAWAQGASMEECCQRGRLAEGDFIQLIQKTIDLLGQLREAAEVSRRPAGEGLPVRLAEAARLLRRGVVAHTYAMVVGGIPREEEPVVEMEEEAVRRRR
ncbi:MAG: DEAD/DEAH box helicase [Dehalococcoidales bacterium]|nr:DEAD/DEAH box helicase [Dehalococcoidales bacterium]